jgi:hypothetical protein
MPAGRPLAVPPSMHVPQCRRDKQLRDMQQQQRDMEARMEAPIEAGSIRPGLY